MLIRIIIVIANYHVADQIGWLLHALMFLSLSILILIVHAALQEKLHECVGWFITSSIWVSDTTTLVLVITFHFLLPSSNETLPLVIMIACGFPQLVLLLIVTTERKAGGAICCTQR